MSANNQKPELPGRRSFFFSFGKGTARKLARLATPVEEVIVVKPGELTEHKKDDLQAFLGKLAGRKEGNV